MKEMIMSEENVVDEGDEERIIGNRDECI